MSIEKLATETTDAVKCPKCGAATVKKGRTTWCPNCGTEPFEKKHDKTEKK